MTTYGITPAGFVIKRQADIIAELQARFRVTFGNTVNLDPRGLFGQLIGIFSEREALEWELMQAVYASQFPSGAEGVSVDNILAMSNMTRLSATPSRTDPTPVPLEAGHTLYGLVLSGTPGLVVPAGSIVRSATAVPVDFALDGPVTILNPVNSQQALLYSAVPDAGGFDFNLPSYRIANEVTTLPVTSETQARRTFIKPTSSGAIGYLLIEDHVFGPYPLSVHFTEALAGVRTIYPDATITGSAGGTWELNIDLGDYHPRIRPNGTKLTWTGTLPGGAWSLNIDGRITDGIASFEPAAIQTAIRALGSPYDEVFVSRSGSLTVHFINWDKAPMPASVATATNLTGLSVTVAQVTVSPDAPDDYTIVDDLMTLVQTARESDGKRPFTDVGVAATSTTRMDILSGDHAPRSGEPSSGERPVPGFSTDNNSLLDGATLVTPRIEQIVEGAPARGVGTATATEPGPAVVAAGQLTVIGTPIDGWAGVNNELDVIPGTDAESDRDALIRRTSLLAGVASGPIQSIEAHVREVGGVQSAVGMVNPTDAALQRVAFSSVPVTGTWRLSLPLIATTASMPYNATAAQVQSALRALAGYERVVVTGSVAAGFLVDFNGSAGGAGQPRMVVSANSTSVDITVSYARAAHSFEMIVLGGDAAAIARAIYEKMPAGSQAYGSPVAVTEADLTSDDVEASVSDATGILAGQSVFGVGVPAGAIVLSVVGTTVTLNVGATATLTTTLTFDNTTLISDSYGTQVQVNFTRPTPVLVYVTVQLVTDTYRVPGDPTSGVNPRAQFNPATMASIQADLLAIGDKVLPAGIIVGKGTNGLIGAFNDVLGVIDYDLKFGLSPSPSGDEPIYLLPTQAPVFQAQNIEVSFS